MDSRTASGSRSSTWIVMLTRLGRPACAAESRQSDRNELSASGDAFATGSMGRLPKPQDCTGCGGRGLELRELAIRSATAGSHADGGVRAALPGARSVEEDRLANRL